MKNILFLLLFTTVNLLANINVVVSITPQKFFLDKIGGDKVDVTIMVKPGNSPHTYEPKPSQMKYISNADIYFCIGVEFENSWLDKFANQNKKMKIIDVSQSILRYNKKDPHIWTAPSNVKIIAKNILTTLVEVDNKNAEYYTKNYNDFISYIDKIDNKIKLILRNSKNSKFMVFHPSWGYFAKQYNLVQFPIEIQGKAPKPKDIIRLINIAKSEKVKAIFTQPEFSSKIASTIADQLHIKVVPASPLDIKWGENLVMLATTIAK